VCVRVRVCLILCYLETSTMRQHRPELGGRVTEINKDKLEDSSLLLRDVVHSGVTGAERRGRSPRAPRFSRTRTFSHELRKFHLGSSLNASETKRYHNLKIKKKTLRWKIG
jgi:hypothetical protein